MIVQGTVQRLVMGDGMPRTEHRTRDLGAMFVETEWGWSERASEAYVFPEYAAAALPTHAYAAHATTHAEALTAAGEKHVHACVHGSEAKATRELSRASRDAALDATVRDLRVSPEESYRNLERRRLD